MTRRRVAASCVLLAIALVATTVTRATQAAPTAWFCPMHSDVTSAEAGRCPKCGMALIAGDPFEFREYRLDFGTQPAAVAAGAPVTMRFRIGHPADGRPVEDFEVVHDRQYHLFVISRDLSEFQHIHPERQADGAWAIQTTLPRPGYYQVLSDFVPKGGAPQFLGRPLVTARFDGDLDSARAPLVPDSSLTKTAGSLSVRVSLEPATLIAGQNGHFTYTLVDGSTSQPVTDLEPYLGAFGHTLLLSEDFADYVHSHPVEGPEHDISRGLGGPTVTFEGYLPWPGLYRAWTQFRRRGEVTTVSYTFSVASLEDATRGRP
jgi:hypothetical protein